MLEDLIKAAYNDAKTKLDAENDGSMSGLMGGMQMPPGMKFPF
jgi:DNA-binding protein YbaB